MYSSNGRSNLDFGMLIILVKLGQLRSILVNIGQTFQTSRNVPSTMFWELFDVFKLLSDQTQLSRTKNKLPNFCLFRFSQFSCLPLDIMKSFSIYVSSFVDFRTSKTQVKQSTGSSKLIARITGIPRVKKAISRNMREISCFFTKTDSRFLSPPKHISSPFFP